MKKVKKANKIKEEKFKSEDQESIIRFIKILIGVIICVVLIYFITRAFVKKDLTDTKEETPVTEEQTNVVEFAISKLLHSLGIPSHIKGYQYIRESIYLMYHNPNLISGITKEVYPEIAIKFDTTASRVERAIRHAIEVSWNRGDYELMEEIFGHSVDYDRAKPTNSEFIATLADKLRIDKSYIKVNA